MKLEYIPRLIALGSEHIPTLIALVIVALMGIITIIKSILDNKDESYLKHLMIVTREIEKFMKEAEKIENLSGREKKVYVMKKIEEFLEENGIMFPLSEVSEIIERIIDLTKQIN